MPKSTTAAVEFDRHAANRGDPLPPGVRRNAVEIGAARVFGQSFDFHHRECFALRLTEAIGWRTRKRSKRFKFTAIEPDEVTMRTNIDIDAGLVGNMDLEHWFPALRTSAAAQSFVPHCMKPERIDRSRRKHPAQ